MSDTLIISRELPNDEIRFGETGSGTKDLRRAIELFQAGESESSGGATKLYLDRLKRLSAFKRVVVESEPESAISTFIAQAVHLLSNSSCSDSDMKGSRSVLLPSVNHLEFGPDVFLTFRSLHFAPFFQALITSTPDLTSLSATLPQNYDHSRPPDAPGRLSEYLRHARTKANGWSRLAALDVTGEFDRTTTTPVIPGGRCRIAFRSSGKVWPEQGESYHMATPSVYLSEPTRRLARATSIRHAISGTIHAANACPRALARVDSTGTGQEGGVARGRDVHGEVILDDYDIGLNEAGTDAADAEWVEEKVRGFIRGEYGKYGTDVEAAVQNRVSFNRTKVDTPTLVNVEP